MGLATAVSITALIVFGICGLLVTQTWRIILGILFAVTTVGCGKTLQWSITAYRAFSYNGTRQLSRKTKTCNLPVPNMFCAPNHERSKCYVKILILVLLLYITLRKSILFKLHINQMYSCFLYTLNNCSRNAQFSSPRKNKKLVYPAGYTSPVSQYPFHASSATAPYDSGGRFIIDTLQTRS